MFGIGEFPIGGFPDADSVSIADPLLGLLSDPSVPREFLLRSVVRGEQPILSDSGEPILSDSGLEILSDIGDIDIDLSSSGYTSRIDDDPYKLFHEALVKSYHFSVDLSTNHSNGRAALTGGISLGIGDITAKNPDGSLDKEATYDWLASDLDLYIGQKSGALSSFTRFCHGVAAGVAWDLDTISILHRDVRLKLQKRLQQNRYYGTGPCLRFDGSGDYVDYGDILDQGVGDSFTIQILNKSETLGTVKVLVSKISSALSTAGFAFYFDASNNLIAYIRDNTNQISASYAGASLLDGSRHKRLTMVVDRTAQRIYIYVGSDLVATSGDISGVGSLSNSQPLRVGSFGDGASSNQGDMDDFRFWSTARSQEDIAGDAYREILPQASLEIYSKYNENDLSTAGDSSGNSHNGTITGATWVGSLEGDSSLANTVKPVLVGQKDQIAPKVVDSTRLIYQWHDGLGEALDDVKDSGDSYTFGSEVSDIQSSAPAAGSYNVSRTIHGSYFRLGSSPVGVITCSARGDAGGSLGYVDDVSGIIRKLLTQFAGQSDGSLNLHTFISLGLGATATIGFYFDSDINIDAALDKVTVEGGSAWWAPDRIGNISVGRIDNPDSLGVDVEVTADDLIEPRKGGVYKRVPLGVRVGQVVLGYRHYGVTLSEDQVAESLDIATRNDLGQAYRFVTATDPDRSEDSDTLTIHTEIYNKEDAQIEADRLLSIWKEDRGLYTVSLGSGLLSYFIGTVFRVRVNRYDTRGEGKKFIVTGLTEGMGQYGTADKLEPRLFG